MLKVLMLSCEKATALVEKRSTVGLSFIDGMRLNMHQKVCVMCQHYVKQSELIDQYLERKASQQSAEKADREKLKTAIFEKVANLEK